MKRGREQTRSTIDMNFLNTRVPSDKPSEQRTQKAKRITVDQRLAVTSEFQNREKRVATSTRTSYEIQKIIYVFFLFCQMCLRLALYALTPL
jgi:hypothetical protein